MKIFDNLLDYKLILSTWGVDDPDACMKWAFGEMFGVIALKYLPEIYRKLHPDEPMIYDHDLISSMFEKVAKAYLNTFKGVAL